MSEVDVIIEVCNVRNGWADASVRAGESSYLMSGFSYTTNAFADMIRFGVDVALDAHKVEARFDGEPAGWLWRFETRWSQVGAGDHFSVYDIEDYYDPNSKSLEVLSAQVDREQFARAILDALDKLEKKMTLEGFEKSWLQPYPARGVAALRAALETTRRPQPDMGEPVAVVRIIGKADE